MFTSEAKSLISDKKTSKSKTIDF